MSRAAGELVWALLRLPGSCPSVFQARIGPWKGVWIVSVSNKHSQRPCNKDDIWIEVTPTQKKFSHHVEDEQDSTTFDPERLTFEVLQWSHKPSCSNLHIDFLTILEDRGVKKAQLGALVQELLEAQRKDLLAIFEAQDGYPLYRWVELNFGFWSDVQEDYEPCQIHLPSEKVKLLLQVVE